MEDDTLIGASSDASGGYELQTIDANGVVETVPRIEVAANHTLQVSSLQVVLTNLSGELSKGDAIAVALEFEKAGDLGL